MKLFVSIEASTPDGTMYRVVLGMTLVIPLVSWIIAIARWF